MVKILSIVIYLKVSLVTGDPSTSKTSLFNSILKILKVKDYKVLLYAT